MQIKMRVHDWILPNGWTLQKVCPEEVVEVRQYVGCKLIRENKAEKMRFIIQTRSENGWTTIDADNDEEEARIKADELREQERAIRVMDTDSTTEIRE